MKTAKSSKRRPELSYKSEEIESLKTLPNQVLNEGGVQVRLMRDDFFSQLTGFANDYEGPANDYEGPEVAQAVAGKTSETKHEVILFQLLPSTFTEKPAVRRPEGKSAKAEIRTEPGISYHSEYFESLNRVGENLSRNESNEQTRKIKQIVDEIKKLAATTKELQMEFGHITVASAPAPSNPGKYYTNFFEWLLIMLKQARQKVENSKSWLDALQGKSSKKLGYWGRAKKFGTSFTQNNERNVATSTG